MTSMDEQHPLDFGLLVTAEAICREIDHLRDVVASIVEQLATTPLEGDDGSGEADDGG